MNSKLSKSTLAWRLMLIFVVIFLVVFGVLTILQFLNLASYAPFVAGALAGGSAIALNILVNRWNRKGKSVKSV